MGVTNHLLSGTILQVLEIHYDWLEFNDRDGNLDHYLPRIPAYRIVGPWTHEGHLVLTLGLSDPEFTVFSILLLNPYLEDHPS